MSRFCIRERLEAALEKMRWQQMEVRVINLTEADRKALDRLLSREFGGGFKVHALGYREHIVRPGKKSSIQSTRGCEVAIPKRLSPRVEAPTQVAA